MKKREKGEDRQNFKSHFASRIVGESLISIMAAAGGNDIIRYIYRGEVGERIPWEATHITVAETCTVILRDACGSFGEYPRTNSIVDVICHDEVRTIEEYAFYRCLSLRRVIMPGVRVVGEGAFWGCHALTAVECEKLEIIRASAFRSCSLRSINVSTVAIVHNNAFCGCDFLNLEFGSKLERIEEQAFYGCFDLERITITLSEGEDLFTADNVFQACEKLEHVTIVEEEEVLGREIMAALHLEQWRNDIIKEIDSINHILPTARAGEYAIYWDDGEKTQVIRRWIRSVDDKVDHYMSEHQCILEDAAATLQLVLPRDIVVNNVVPFLALAWPEDILEVEEDEGDMVP